jgi:hypothetical protein
MKKDIQTLAGAEADQLGLARFSKAMRDKLAKKRSEGRSGWNYPPHNGYGTTVKRLRRMMADHVAKGDPIDIANFCMMIWNRENPGPTKRGPK